MPRPQPPKICWIYRPYRLQPRFWLAVRKGKISAPRFSVHTLLALRLQALTKEPNFRGPHAPRSPMAFVIPIGSASRLLPSIHVDFDPDMPNSSSPRASSAKGSFGRLAQGKIVL